LDRDEFDMIVGVAGITHTPLADYIRAPLIIEKKFRDAISNAAQTVKEWRPDLTVVFFPDHLNGFLYDLMPAFCVGIQGESIGDWGTIPGRIDIPESTAADCARACLDAGVDVAFSYRMLVDHGYAQVVEYLAEALPMSATIPIFINCAAPPRPTLVRCRALGQAIGRWAEGLDARVLFIASGGLSHDPPTPEIAQVSPEVRARLIGGVPASHSERFSRQQNVRRLGLAFPKGDSGLRALNPKWDQAFLENLSGSTLDFADHYRDDELTETAGRGAHEIRTWLAAWSAAAVAGPLHTEIGFSEPIEEWITACAIATATPSRASAAMPPRAFA
jgi:2,3-dihydroxyphenylpropionate 1,2-dioxygenase